METTKAASALIAPPQNGEVRERFPVTIFYRNGHLFKKSAVEGWAETYDQEGLRIRSDHSLPSGKKVEVRFKAPLSLCLAAIPCIFPAEITSTKESGASPRFEHRVKWTKPLPKLLKSAIAAHLAKVGCLVSLVLGWTMWLRWSNIIYFWHDPIFYGYTIAVGFYFMTRFYLASIHRPPALAGYEPSLSVVISVRNEEGAIAQTVESCFMTDYPDSKREVIVVNDGSTDGTAKVLASIEKRWPKLKVFSIPPSGKRHGMSKGVREAKGELIVFVDSDTFLDKMALKYIVCGFEDPTLGAVSGFTGVENKEKNLLTRMQDVRYVMSYELMKSPEAVFDAVTCCPGCLSAYRRKYLLEVLDPWLNQTFLGAPATFGDDRSLTNYILRNYRVTYNPFARSTTFVPENWEQYFTQQCRWKKSWVRETWIAARFMHKKHPFAALSFYVAAMCSIFSPFVIMRAVFLELTNENAMLSVYVAGLALLGLSMVVFVHWRRPNKNWALIWLLVVLQVVVMGPQTYYALLTMRKNHWGTR